MSYKRLGSSVAILLFVAFLVTTAGASSALAGEKFQIISSHTPETCLKTLDEVSAKNPKLLSKFDWGCNAGDHTGYAVVEAKDEAAVRAMLPAGMQDAKIVKLNKFTMAQIKSFHESK
jgi:hypothetical protein